MRLGLGLGLGSRRGARFDPSKVDGLKLWLDFADTSTITDSSGTVTAVTDKSGSGNNATGNGTVTTGTRTLNGKNVIDFAGGKLTIADDPDFNSNQDFTALVIFATDTAGGNDPIFNKYGTGGFSWRLEVDGATNGLSLWATPDNSTLDKTTRQNALTVVNEPRIMGVRYTFAETAKELLYDRTPNQYREIGAIYDGTSALTLGAPTTGTLRMNGVIAEVLYYNRKLTDIEIDQIGAYLSSKWGAPWATAANTLIASTQGQSNMTNAFRIGDNGYDIYNEEGKIAFDTAIANYFTNVEYLSNAKSATPVLEANASGSDWWIDNDLTDGPILTQWKNQMEGSNTFNGISAWGDASKVRATVWIGGEGDFGTNKANFDAAIEKLFNETKDYTRTDHKIIVAVPGTRGASFDDTYQDVRDVVLEKINDMDFVEFGAECFDLELADDTHYTAEAQAILHARLAESTAAVMGKRSRVGTLGPIITSATYSGSTVTATVELDGAAAISGSDVNQFRIEDDGSPVTISSINVSGTTITFTLSSPIAGGSVVNLWCNYGRGASMDKDNMVKDANGLPMRSVSGLSVTEA